MPFVLGLKLVQSEVSSLSDLWIHQLSLSESGKAGA
jgi:hypothetical protein